MHTEVACFVAGLVGAVVGMLTLSVSLAVILWAAAALAGKVREREGDE